MVAPSRPREMGRDGATTVEPLPTTGAEGELHRIGHGLAKDQPTRATHCDRSATRGDTASMLRGIHANWHMQEPPARDGRGAGLGPNLRLAHEVVELAVLRAEDERAQLGL